MLNLCLIFAAALNGLAWLLSLFKKQRIALILFAAAWLPALGAFSLNWLSSGEPPFGSMYHVQVVLGLCFVPLYFLMIRDAKFRWILPYFAFIAMLPMVGALFMDKSGTWRRMPALQSPWFVPHVLAYMISYALCAAAFAMMLVKRVAKKSAEYEQAVIGMIRLAFPFMTFGLLSGALWADEAWGVYWSWDPKETWALITWMSYAVVLHTHRSLWKKSVDLAHSLAFLALLTTFFLVNILPKLASALHSYT
jgi:ABC-type transport system involved in cytochrome c biogenesis permease subunit